MNLDQREQELENVLSLSKSSVSSEENELKPGFKPISTPSRRHGSRRSRGRLATVDSRALNLAGSIIRRSRSAETTTSSVVYQRVPNSSTFSHPVVVDFVTVSV